jgi:hypothetical protein
MSLKTWYCKIGEVSRDVLPKASDPPMRDAIELAYINITGQQPDFIFSGWGAELTEPERAVVEHRPPVKPEPHEPLLTIRNFLLWQHAINGSHATEDLHAQLFKGNVPMPTLDQALDALHELESANAQNT